LAKRTLVQAIEGFIDFLDRLFLIGQETEGEFLFIVIRSLVGGMQRCGGAITIFAVSERFVRQMRDISCQAGAQGSQRVAKAILIGPRHGFLWCRACLVLCPFRPGHSRYPGLAQASSRASRSVANPGRAGSRARQAKRLRSPAAPPSRGPPTVRPFIPLLA